MYITRLAISKTKMGWLICGVGALFYCYEYLLRIAPATMLGALMKSFDLSAESLGTVISLFYLSYAPLQLLTGPAHDIFGPRRVLTVAIGFCFLGSLLFGLATSPIIISIARLLIGFGSAFAFVGIAKLGSIWLPRRYFSLFIGLTISLGMLGAMSGNIIITTLIKYIPWRHFYYYGTFFGVILMAAMWWLVNDSPKKTKKKLIRITKRSQLRKQFLEIFRNPQLWLIGIIAAFLYLSLSALADLWGNKFIQQVYHFSVTEAAITNSTIYLGWLLGAPFMGWLADKIQQRRILILINSFLACLIFFLLLTFFSLPLFLTRVLFFLLGFFCSAQILCFSAAVEKVPHALSATAVGFVNFLVMLGGFIFQPLVGYLLDFHWLGKIHNGVRVYSEQNFRFALSVLLIGFLLAGILSFFIQEKKRRKRKK